MKPGYREGLALVHDEGFGHLASGAAALIVEELRRRGRTTGTVVDLGCGSGITARRLADAGYTVHGLDLSAPMIELARARVPEASFAVGSFVDADLPSCVAVTAIGEVLSYAFDAGNDAAARKALFRRIFEALMPGGLFLFDVAGPGRAPAQRVRRFVEGEGWVVFVETTAEGAVLERRLTTFRAEGELYRREDELHQLHIIEPKVLTNELRSAGFEVRTVDRYDDVELHVGLAGFLASRTSH